MLGQLLALDDRLELVRDPLQQLGRGLVGDAEVHQRPAPLSSGPVLQRLLEQFGVGDHHFLAVQRADPRRLEADLLDRAGGRRIAEADRVAAAERPVEDDRERREQVGEDALGGEADGDAADAEAGDQAGDVDAEIVEDDDDRDREQGDGDEQADDADRRAQPAAVGFVAEAVLDIAEDELAAPDRRLERGRDDEEDVDRPLQEERRLGLARHQLDRGGGDESRLVRASTRPKIIRQLTTGLQKCCPGNSAALSSRSRSRISRWPKLRSATSRSAMKIAASAASDEVEAVGRDPVGDLVPPLRAALVEIMRGFAAHPRLGCAAAPARSSGFLLLRPARRGSRSGRARRRSDIWSRRGSGAVLDRPGVLAASIRAGWT